MFPKIYNMYLCTFVACISGFMYGFDVVSLTTMVDTNSYGKYFDHPDSTGEGGITASIAGGSAFGALASPYFSDTFGRKFSLHLCSFFWIIGSVLQCAAQNLPMLIIGRIISGFGIGFGVAAAPMYSAELSPPNMRGTIVGMFQVSVTLGILILFFIGYGCHSIESTAAFRIVWGIQLVPGVISACLIFFIPESPRWLASHKRWNDATNVIMKLSLTHSLSEEQTNLQLNELKDYILGDRYGAVFAYRDLFKRKSLMKTIVGMSAQTWQAFCGINVMMYYVVYIFQMAGYQGSSILVSSSIEYILNFAMTFCSLFIFDKIGRRKLFLTGGVFMCCFLFIETGLLAGYSKPLPYGYNGHDTVRIYIPNSERPAAHAAIACAYLFVCAFAPTWGVGVWIYYSEIFNNTERAKGTALSVSCNFFANFALALFTPASFRNINWRTYIIFGVFSFVLTVHTFLMFPETNRKSLEEIDLMWDAHIPAWRTSKWKPDKNKLVSIKSNMLSDGTQEEEQEGDEYEEDEYGFKHLDYPYEPEEIDNLTTTTNLNSNNYGNMIGLDRASTIEPSIERFTSRSTINNTNTGMQLFPFPMPESKTKVLFKTPTNNASELITIQESMMEPPLSRNMTLSPISSGEEEEGQGQGQGQGQEQGQGQGQEQGQQQEEDIVAQHERILYDQSVARHHENINTNTQLMNNINMLMSLQEEPVEEGFEEQLDGRLEGLANSQANEEILYPNPVAEDETEDNTVGEDLSLVNPVELQNSNCDMSSDDESVHMDHNTSFPVTPIQSINDSVYENSPHKSVCTFSNPIYESIEDILNSSRAIGTGKSNDTPFHDHAFAEDPMFNNPIYNSFSISNKLRSSTIGPGDTPDSHDYLLGLSQTRSSSSHSVLEFTDDEKEDSPDKHIPNITATTTATATTTGNTTTGNTTTTIQSDNHDDSDVDHRSFDSQEALAHSVMTQSGQIPGNFSTPSIANRRQRPYSDISDDCLFPNPVHSNEP
ncbi:hypothetical protein TBLA_0C01090 [Henningerozyma blattae CBS 6284]|uniref:Major facilitator superfamily (MFS) profile domain-containing protein n=1 Tax=Henningerozyma blattae (strain ATCC 34711 / CBS 6284 / DSM 70876 / NBRC 10599 / NRRL Y-10934 / UCD 77-7) TaxID=1071380 RepID=I2H0M2_HENB6|nr:hypothetical protein TBLA_0C01090 [Tetrapisispora blattae CBS 6284]CCH59924.1 hypothetical protein TBLA_0C01090 [Tetrapisispora blattae CBS 6284]